MLALLFAAIGKIKLIADAVNESKRALENLTTMISVQNRLGSDFDLIAPHRHLVRKLHFTLTASFHLCMPSAQFDSLVLAVPVP